MINILKKTLFVGLLIGIMHYLTGCSGTTVTSVQTTEQNLNETVKYEGPKARIAVADFKCVAAKCNGYIGEGIRDMLVDALVKTGKFIVLERGEGLEAIKKELELGQSGLVQPGKAPKPGLLEGADILVVGSIVAFEPNAGGIKGGIGGIVPKVPILGGIKLGKEDAYIVVILRLIDVRTGRIINSTRIEGKASSFSVGGLGGGIIGTVPLGGGLEVYKNTPMEKAVMVLLDNAVKAIEKSVPESYYRYNAKGLPIKPTVQTTNTVDNSTNVETHATHQSAQNLKLIFSDDFESYGIGQKTPLTKWKGTAEATVRLKPQINKNLGKILDFHDLHNFICAKIPKQKDFVVILLRKNDDYHDANLFFRVNEKIGYKLKMRGERYYIKKVSGNDEVEIADNGGGKAYNNWYKTKLVVNGSNIKVYDGNRLILDINDNDQFLNKAGDICINGEAWFDDIEIYEIVK